MKRDTALVGLSHDHHQALFVAMALRRVDQAGLADARAQALAFWHDHGARHFQVEEQVLLPAYARWADPDETVARMLVEHVRIRERMDRLAEDALTLEEVQGLGALMAEHVRLEERTVFPQIEAVLDAEALEALAARLAEAEAETT